MLRRLAILSALLWICSAPAYSQDEPSLGDVAREARSQKSSGQSKNVITNENLPSDSTISVFGRGDSSGANGLGKLDSSASPEATLNKWEAIVKYVASLDRPTLVNLALKGAQGDFPGRSGWEDRLVTARQTYVFREWDLLQKARQLVAAAQALHQEHAGDNDPRVKDLMAKLKALVQGSVQAESAFEAIVMEGRDLAQHASNP